MPSIYNSLFLPELVMMIEEHDDFGMAEFCNALHPGVIAEVMEGWDPAKTWDVLKHSTPVREAEIFEFFSLPYQEDLVKSVDQEHLSKVIEQMSADDRVDLLDRLDDAFVETLLPLVAQPARNDIRRLLSYPEGSAGSIMTTDYASLPANITVIEAMDLLREQAPHSETIYYIYITDKERHLIGFLTLRRLLQAKAGAILSDIMDTRVISVRVDDDQEFVAQEMSKYGFIAIPVVDNHNKLVGIVTHDDATEVTVEEATEDAHRLGAVAPLEDSYLDTPFFTLAWKRGIWLVILMFASCLTAHVINLFEPGAHGNWMVLFLPLVLASGGNAGSQSATLVVRAISQNETEGHIQQIAWREFRIGLLLGSTLASIAFLAGMLLLGSIKQSSVIGMTVLMVVTMGTLTGSMLPLGLRKMGADPAIMSNPLIASLSDIGGVVIYYNIARSLVGAAVKVAGVPLDLATVTGWL
ncbi:magnesium transporter [Planctomyces sp. SH-PL14]|uniref:magnesium transporter n=1 Tax=Planctomyces sp. SH-PL14 TaxID=1632864 RepID=UPI00078D1112|nr:magnesium transporter [Planctomyces sp. SH-PL14]AMV18479.1 Magnesium transporter MgtE [Planctomyces sp. SH-PL14]